MKTIGHNVFLVLKLEQRNLKSHFPYFKTIGRALMC